MENRICLKRPKKDLEILFRKGYKGFSTELRMANMLAACSKRITIFSKACKNKYLEAELIMHVLEVPFSLSTESFGTCFTNYNHKVVQLVKRIITLVESKLHEDYKIQFQQKINEYLSILYRTSSHLDYVCRLPKSI